MENNPEEKINYDSFRKIVENDAEPLNPEMMRKPVKIAIIYPGVQKSDYWRRSVLSFSARMDELKIDHTIVDSFTRAGTIDADILEQQITESLKDDPDYLIFTLDISRHKELIDRIITLGRPKLILQGITTPLKEWEKNQPFLYVGFSHKLGTETILAPEFIKRTNGIGNYAILYFTKGFVSEQRGHTFIDYMNNNSDLILKTAYYTDGQYNKAREATENILSEFKNLDFIYACSTDIALAAVEVLEEKGLKEDIIVNGWGGGSEELESIKIGGLDFTVMRINDDNGVAMAEAIKMDLLGEDSKVPTVYSGDLILITQETTTMELDNFKRRAFRYSGYEK